MNLRGRILMGVFAIAASTAAFAGYDVTEDFAETHPLSATGRVSLDNVNGDVTIEAWDRDEVRIQAVKRTDSQETMDDLEIQTDASADRLRIHTEYPKWNGIWHGVGRKAEVTYTVMVPRLARLDSVELVNGDLSISGVEGGVSAENVNGRLEAIGVAGEVNLSVVNGNVDARLVALDPRDDVEIESVNGKIDIALPGGSSADIDAETVNGSIDNDFGLEVKKGKYVGASMKGVIGSGGARIHLETVNGRISLTQD